jgi:hypothetical protein
MFLVEDGRNLLPESVVEAEEKAGEGGGVVEEVREDPLVMEEMGSSGRSHRGSPGCHLHDNAVGVEVGGGLGDLGLGGGRRHVD